MWPYTNYDANVVHFTPLVCSTRNAGWIIKWNRRWKRNTFHIHRCSTDFFSPSFSLSLSFCDVHVRIISWRTFYEVQWGKNITPVQQENSKWGKIQLYFALKFHNPPKEREKKKQQRQKHADEHLTFSYLIWIINKPKGGRYLLIKFDFLWISIIHAITFARRKMQLSQW